MDLKKGINYARQLANLKGTKDYDFYNCVVNWLQELDEFRERSLKEKFHGMSDTRIYHIWVQMKARCYNAGVQGYNHYGGRGIKVCDEWKGANGFWNFYNWANKNGYKENLSIDRIDVDGDYCPQNCRWVTYKEQAMNRHNNIIITYKQTTMSLAEWAERLNVSYFVLYNRLSKGWSIEKTLETPVDKRKSNKNSGRKKQV